MHKAIVVVVGDTPLNLLNDLFKQNAINTTVIDSENTQVNDLSHIITTNEEAQCFFLANVPSPKKILDAVSASAESVILLYCSPVRSVSHVTEQSSGAAEPRKIISRWQQTLSEALSVVQENSHVLLCDLDDILANSAAFLTDVFNIKPGADVKANTYAKQQFSHHLANIHLFEQDDVFALYDEALSIGQLYGEFTVHLGPDTDDIKQSAVKSGKAVLQQFVANHQNIQNKTQQIENLASQVATLQSDVQKRLEEVAAEKLKIDQANQKFKDEQAKQTEHIRSLTEQIESLQETKRTLEKNIAELKVEVDESKALSTQHKENFDALQKQLESTKQNLNDVQQARQQLTDKYSKLEKEQQKLNLEYKKAMDSLAVKEDELTSLQSQVQHAEEANRVLNQEKAELTASLETKIKELEQTKASLSALTPLPKELAKVNEQYELAMHQIAQLQEELETTVAELNELKPLPAKVEELSDALQQEKQHAEALGAESELADLQIAQLQEELETTVAELNQLKPLPAKVEELTHALQQEKLHAEDAEAKHKLAELQISQLQEELERSVEDAAEHKALLTKTSGDLEEATKVNETLKTTNRELDKRVNSLNLQVEAALTSQNQTEQALITELQTQLEHQITSTEKAIKAKNKLAKQLQVVEGNMTDKNSFNTAELELASLQISQLQEELEYYYQAYQNVKNKGTTVTTMAKQRQKVFSKANASGFEVTGKYSEDGYRDIHLLLTNVQLGNGSSYSSLPVKLVNVGGFVGIEFRDNDSGTLFRHFEDSTDDYGPYLRYFAKAPEAQKEQQQRIFNRMIASERVLVMSTITLLAELLQNQNIPCAVQVEHSEWRDWRLAAIELAEAVDELPAWLSFDNVTLKEEYRTEGYEHLWLSFDHVLVGDNYQECLELKIAANNVADGENPFSRDIALEFRALNDGTVPLLTWPPETSDEFGPKLVMPLNDLAGVSQFASPDRNLITHLVNNLPSIIEKLQVEQSAMTRPKSEWIDASEYVLGNAAEAKDSDEQESQNTITLEEVISMGSYQHLLFSSNADNTKVKLKAQSINPDTFDAELYIELRNGAPDVIYCDTEFFGEDEYGPRVQVPAEVMFTEIQTQRQEQFEWLLGTYEQIRGEIVGNSEIDELIKRLWVNLITRKEEISAV
ncbi:hypothetical protein [Alteromonas sp. 14N.309.X.WAT.G.H12]|uniref:hypothetical protein n=1 Tax=Alteromonas sp. 14N.309.X.WAT.G.H12 TaxID=3120824 RepID=UPI002FCF9F18